MHFHVSVTISAGCFVFFFPLCKVEYSKLQLLCVGSERAENVLRQQLSVRPLTVNLVSLLFS